LDKERSVAAILQDLLRSPYSVMGNIIAFSDRKPAGTFAQIRLDDGKRILVSISQSTIIIFKLAFKGTIPVKKIFKHDLREFLTFFYVRIKRGSIDPLFLKAIVEYILPCKNIDEVVTKLNAVIEGYDDPTIKAAIQQKFQNQF